MIVAVTLLVIANHGTCTSAPKSLKVKLVGAPVLLNCKPLWNTAVESVEILIEAPAIAPNIKATLLEFCFTIWLTTFWFNVVLVSVTVKYGDSNEGDVIAILLLLITDQS